MNDDLDFNLRMTAANLDIPPGDVDAVINRARRRTARGRRLMAVGAATAIVASTAAVVQVRGSGHDGVPVAVGGAPAAGDAGVEWRMVNARTSIGQGVVSSGDRPLYALSTAAGDRDVTKMGRKDVVWRSEDGIEWTSVSSLGDDLYLADLAQRAQRIYAIGTGPATRGASGGPATPVLVGWSDDGAKTWQRAPVPIDMASIRATATWVSVMQPRIATGPQGTVAVVNVSSELDVPKLLPAGRSAPNGWAVTETGVDVLGPRPAKPCPAGASESPPGMTTPSTVKPVPLANEDGTPMRMWSTSCFAADGTQSQVSPQQVHGVVASYSFADLGLKGDALLAARGQPMALWAPVGGTDFRRIELPELASVGTFELEADDDGFDLVASTYRKDRGDAGGLVLLRSSDGQRWSTQSSVEGRSVWSSAFGRLAGQRTMIGGGEDGAVLLRESSEGKWTPSALSAAVDPSVVGDGTVHVAVAGIGPFGAVAVVFVAPPADATKREQERKVEFRLLTSRDGITWQDQPLDGLVGSKVTSVTRVLVNDTNALVTVSIGQDGGPSRQLTLQGTSI